MRLAIIPARSGSKGLPNKNILPLNGRHLMGYTIEAAVESRRFDHILVSTDSEEYAAISRQYGAEVPFLRSAVTSGDTASTWDVVREVLHHYGQMGESFDSFMVLQPTSPFRTAKHIQEAVELMTRRKAVAVVSVCKAAHSPDFYKPLPPDLSMKGYLKDLSKSRRQDHSEYYYVNGAIYLANTSYFLETGNIYEGNCIAYIMDEMSSMDIDGKTDFQLAEAIMEMKKAGD